MPNLPGGLKMSEVLDEFIDPLKSEALSDDELREIYALGSMAWNLSFLSAPERKRAFEDAAKANRVPKREWTTMWSLVEQLVQRKHDRFDSINRQIVDFSMESDEDGIIHLNVLSIIPTSPESPE